MVIILALCIPVTALVTGYFALKGVEVGLGLRQEKPKPVEPVNEPVKQPDKPKEPDKTQFAEMMNEWLNGESR